MIRSHTGDVRLFAFLLTLVGVLLGASARADVQCDPPGQTCSGDASCTGGKICVGNQCEFPCMVTEGTDKGAPNPALCQWGETCVRASTGRYYCEGAEFTLDLNLLDSCIYHFIEGIPVELGENACSLESRLASMMGDGKYPFDIFDLDLCIKNFLDQEPCDVATQTCLDEDGDSTGVFCTLDAQCGKGLFCNQEMHRCERECGFIPDRSRLNASSTLERECARPLQICDYERGRCMPVNLGNQQTCSDQKPCPDGSFCRDGMCQLTCEIDRDCPVGAYCAMGQCTPKCFRSLDCPDSGWYCDTENRCQPRPATDTGAAFDPKRYVVRFAESRVNLDLYNNSYEIPLVIMDQLQDKPVFSSPNVVFGYRLEARYGLKQSPACQGNLAGNDALQKECILDPSRYFLIQDVPFGRIYGDGAASIAVRIDPTIAEKLTPGDYPVTLSAFFSNGSTTSVEVMLRKPSPNGHYDGRLSLYVAGSPVVSASGEIANHYGDGNFSVDLYVDKRTSTYWDDLVKKQNNLDLDNEFEDLTFGQVVHGFISGNDTPIFDNPNASLRAENKIRVTGLYSPEKRRMRLIGVIDLEQGYCRTEQGVCSGTPPALSARNPFGRKVRRVFQLIGPYDSRIGLFNGIYREVVSGLAPQDIALEGGFRLQKTQQSDATITAQALLPSKSAVSFPQSVSALANQEVNAACGFAAGTAPSSWTGHAAWFRDAERFDCYSSGQASCETSSGTIAGAAAPIIPGATRFLGALGAALDALSTSQAKTLSTYLRSTTQIRFCDKGVLNGTTSDQGCIDPSAVKCGLALYRKSLLEQYQDPTTNEYFNWVAPRQAVNEQMKLTGTSGGTFEPAVLFCSERPGNGNTLCPAIRATAPTLFALQEYAHFYREVVGRMAFEAGNEVSDAFFYPYTAVRGSGSTLGEAFNAKRAHLEQALGWFEQARQNMFATTATGVLYAWPTDAFADDGQEWIQQMEATLLDRLDALIEIADLDRRLYDQASEKRYVLAHHILHVEHLSHLLLASVEEAWEGASFSYSGGGAQMLTKADTFLNKSDESRNPLGLLPGRVYFGSNQPNVTNVQFLYNELEEELQANDTTTLAGLVNGAKSAMETALTNQQNLETAIRNAQLQLAAELDRLCGPEEAFPSGCDVDAASKIAEAECTGPDCLFQFKCESKECSDVAKVFGGAVEKQLECRSDTRPFTVPGADGAARPCMRGDVGALMQQRVALDLRRRQVLRSFRELTRQIMRQQAYINEVRAITDDIAAEVQKRDDKVRQINSNLAEADLVYDVAVTEAEAIKCIVVAGTSAGTDCPQAVASAGIKAVAIETKAAVTMPLEQSKALAVDMAGQRIGALNQQKELAALFNQLDTMMSEVASRVSEYETVTQELYNVDMRIADTQFLAKRAAQRYREELEHESLLLTRLTGFRGNEALRRNQKVIEANQRFEQTLVLAYELAQALRYELNLDDARANANGIKLDDVYKIVTLDDLEAFLRKVNDLTSRDACRVFQDAGIGDCQAWSNTNRYTMSLQKAMFPELRPIVDGETGTTLTVGQQFHRRIMSSGFVKKRMVDGKERLQVELPFTVWPEELDLIVPELAPANLTPGQCNMLIEPAGVSVQVLGQNVAFEVPVDLKRGATDYQRSCFPAANGRRPIVQYTVGWLPGTTGESRGSQFESEIDFQKTIVWSENDTAVWRTAFRDRSLSSPNYLLVIPLTGNSAALLSSTATGSAPIVSDIRIHLKYRAIKFSTSSSN